MTGDATGLLLPMRLVQKDPVRSPVPNLPDRLQARFLLSSVDTMNAVTVVLVK